METPNPSTAKKRQQLRGLMLPVDGSSSVDWVISNDHIAYPDALERMNQLAIDIHAGNAQETIWLVEHPPLYTAGTSAKESDLITPNRFPVHHTGRGGEFTYHGPGQRVVYVMLNLSKRKQDVRAYVAALEEWIITTLEAFNIKGERREDRVGVWIKRPDKPILQNGDQREDKIAAIGVRLKKWVSLHGISINVEPDLEHFSGIVPCGIKGDNNTGHGITSLVDLGLPITMNDLDIALKQNYGPIFGSIE